MLDLPQPLGPTTPTNWPGNWKVVGSTKDLNPDNLMELRRTAQKGQEVGFAKLLIHMNIVRPQRGWTRCRARLS
jgi:hypothetical protein